jgi:hypothetical protein
MSRRSITCCVLLLAGWWFAPSVAHAYSLKDDDNAKLFSKEALSTETETIEGLRLKYRKDIRIQTFGRIPLHKDPLGRVKKMDEAAREHFIADWARSKARTTGTDGVYILILRQPLNVQVVVEQRGKSRPFTDEDADKLRREIFKLVEDKHPDEALHFAVDYGRQRLETAGEEVVVVHYDWAGLAIVLLAVIGAWLALYFLHGFSEGTFPVGSAAIGPLALGVGGHFLSGLRALRGLAPASPASERPVPPDARTIEDSAEDINQPQPPRGED